jgi:hypothetical protein
MTGERAAGARGLAALVLAAALTLSAGPSWAQTPEELRAARELFQEAYKDEQEKRYDDALEKFRRVAKVRESASVRYRIATCLAGAGRLREARDMYRALAAQKASLPASDHETADSAAENAAQIGRRIPRLSLRLADNPPPDVRVSVDGTPVPVSTTPRSIELDPGEHVILAAAPGSKTTEEHLTLAEPDGGPDVARTISLQPETPTGSSPTSSNGAAATGREGAGGGGQGGRSDVVPYVALGGGAVLVIVAGGLLVARENAISDIKAKCPANRCPTSTRSAVDSDRSRSELFGPLAVGVGVVGLAAVGLGAYLLLRPKAPATITYLAPGPGRLGLGLRF